MKITELGTIIAERELEGHLNEQSCKVTVKIGKPFPDPNDKLCWYCPYSISTPTGEHMLYAAGVDSLQTLRLAIRQIDAELTAFYAELKLTWLGGTDLGFSGFL